VVPETVVKREPDIFVCAPDVDAMVLPVIIYVGDIVAPAAQSTLWSAGLVDQSAVDTVAGASIDLPSIKVNVSTDPNCNVFRLSLSK
jgi:hypothetical protein|tara:strand:+ start:359 stop:619 length:261 start_codon:yes stop_codon:yes gene_type:complete